MNYALDDIDTHQTVERFADEWVGTCDHGGGELWTIHRGTAHNAERSLRAHQRECPAYMHWNGMDSWWSCSRPRPCLVCVENDTPAEPRPTQAAAKRAERREAHDAEMAAARDADRVAREGVSDVA